MNHFEQMLHTTLRIEELDAQGSLKSIGTGFLLAKPIDSSQGKVYLVSNRHVLEGAESIIVSLTMSLNGLPQYGNTFRMQIDNVKSGVICHINRKIDVAVLDVTGLFSSSQLRFYVKWFDYSMLSDFNESELSVAEHVQFIGYPDNRYDKANNLPLLRNGVIASNPKVNFDGEPMFIIDAQVFPGSSGSPVIIDLTYENFRNGNIIIGERKLKLLGIVSATMIRNNQLQAITTNLPVLVTQEVLGLGIVFKATVIKEILDSI